MMEEEGRPAVGIANAIIIELIILFNIWTIWELAK